MKRRDFVSKVVAAGVGAAVTTSATSQDTPTGQLARRKYGKDGPDISIIGFGAIVVSDIEQSEANDHVAWAVDRGVNYFDVAPTYGNAQERLGPALKPYRDSAFLACKTTKRDADGAQAELDESFRLLQTDHFDLYQLHGVTSDQDVDQILAPGGALETFVKARDKGQVTHIGFSAHSESAAIRLLDAFDFESVLFPLNCVCMENGNFGPAVVQKAIDKGASLLALKALAWTPWPDGAERTHPKCWYQPITDRERARLALDYTLSLPITAAVTPGDPRMLRMAVELAMTHEPIAPDARTAITQELNGVTPIFTA
ncbi:MAG TPA: aldo/keto reductase [Armatimonadota bacterium]|nr:aldo/keto reductase [Armatimonadota bacterium]